MQPTWEPGSENWGAFARPTELVQSRWLQRSRRAIGRSRSWPKRPRNKNTVAKLVQNEQLVVPVKYSARPPTVEDVTNVQISCHGGC